MPAPVLSSSPSGPARAANRPARELTVCVIAPHKAAQSETFIQAHVERLPARVKMLYGGYFPKYRDDDQPLMQSAPLLSRAAHALVSRFRPGLAERYAGAALRGYLRANRVDVVLAEFGPVGVHVLDVCAAAAVPVVVHFFGTDAYRQSMLETVGRGYPALFAGAAAIVAVSRDMERQLISLGAPADKVHYNPCGADVDRFQGARPAEAPPQFLAVGRFVDKKAPHLTLLAFQRVRAAVPEARLVMMGDGPLWEACRQLATTLGMAAAVEFVGPRPHAAFAEALQRVRAFVQHSVRTTTGDSEGTPVAVLEAGAAGVPVVATRHAGIADVVRHGETGLLVDEYDIAGMADEMIQLARDPGLAGRLGAAARERVAREFSLQRTIEGLYRVLEASAAAHR